MDGCRIGFDLGGSDRKVAAVIDGKVVFSDETVWDPYFNPDPQYHFDGIMDSLKKAAAHLPRVDAIAAKDADGDLWLAITNLDPNQSIEIETTFTGITGKSAVGETLTAPKVDSVNTFDAPNTVVPKRVLARFEGGNLTLKLEPKSVTVLRVED
jgi:alpha-L-arabinofuranosidase